MMMNTSVSGKSEWRTQCSHEKKSKAL